jgi:hypothetical protein
MKPIWTVLSINLAFFAIWGLCFTLLVNRPEMIPLMTSVQATFNLLFAAGFFLDRKKQIGMSFIWGMILAIVITITGYLVLIKFRDLIGVEEDYTTMLQAVVHRVLRA